MRGTAAVKKWTTLFSIFSGWCPAKITSVLIQFNSMILINNNKCIKKGKAETRIIEKRYDRGCLRKKEKGYLLDNGSMPRK